MYIRCFIVITVYTLSEQDGKTMIASSLRSLQGNDTSVVLSTPKEIKRQKPKLGSRQIIS